MYQGPVEDNGVKSVGVYGVESVNILHNSMCLMIIAWLAVCSLTTLWCSDVFDYRFSSAQVQRAAKVSGVENAAGRLDQAIHRSSV